MQRPASREGPDHLAKVGVAGSNPVVRSRSEGTRFRVRPPGISAAPVAKLPAMLEHDRIADRSVRQVA
jgi:hypothetical protein